MGAQGANTGDTHIIPKHREGEENKCKFGETIGIVGLSNDSTNAVIFVYLAPQFVIHVCVPKARADRDADRCWNHNPEPSQGEDLPCWC